MIDYHVSDSGIVIVTVTVTVTVVAVTGTGTGKSPFYPPTAPHRTSSHRLISDKVWVIGVMMSPFSYGPPAVDQ